MAALVCLAQSTGLLLLAGAAVVVQCMLVSALKLLVLVAQVGAVMARQRLTLQEPQERRTQAAAVVAGTLAGAQVRRVALVYSSSDI
jgi:hypothetical protein